MKLKVVVGECAGGTCPTVYESEDGRYFVQGYTTDVVQKSGLSIPENESLVEISLDLLQKIKSTDKINS